LHLRARRHALTQSRPEPDADEPGANELRDDEGQHVPMGDPAKEGVSDRAIVTAGLANEVDAVNQ